MLDKILVQYIAGMIPIRVAIECFVVFALLAQRSTTTPSLRGERTSFAETAKAAESRMLESARRSGRPGAATPTIDLKLALNSVFFILNFLLILYKISLWMIMIEYYSCKI